MAYSFNNLMGAMGKKKSGASDEMGSGNGLQKTGSTEVQAGGGLAGAPAEAAPKNDFAKTNFASTKAIMEKNKGPKATEASVNRVLDPSKQQAQSLQQNISKEATDFAKGAEQKIAAQKGPSGTDIMGYVYGNNTKPGTQEAITGALSGQAADVGALNIAPQQQLATGKYLSSGDVSSLLRQGSKTPYTSGMASLDNMIFGRSNAGKDVQSQVRGLNQGVEDARIAANTGVTKDLQGKAATHAKELQTTTKNTLDSLKREIADTSEMEAKSANTAKGAQLTGQKQALSDDLKAKIKNAAKELEAKYLVTPEGLNTVDVNQFIKDGSYGQLTGANAMNPQQVAAMNRIMALTGGAPIAQQAGGGVQGPTIDQAALDAFLAKAGEDSAYMASEAAKKRQAAPAQVPLSPLGTPAQVPYGSGQPIISKPGAAPTTTGIAKQGLGGNKLDNPGEKLGAAAGEYFDPEKRLQDMTNPVGMVGGSTKRFLKKLFG